MAMTHGASTREGFAAKVLTDVDAGTGVGKIVLRASDDSPLCTIDLPKPSHSQTGPALTMLGTPLDDTAADDGDIAKFTVEDSDGNVVYSNSVGLSGSGAALIVDNTNVKSGQKVTVNSGTYTASE